MTVSESIIQWLKTFKPENGPDMKLIDTDLMHGNVDYALMKEPITNIRHFISGKAEYTEHYQFMARMDALTNADSVDNNEWMTLLSEWIKAQDNIGNFPIVGNADVKKIGISTSFFAGTSVEGNKAIYQLTIFIRYIK